MGLEVSLDVHRIGLDLPIFTQEQRAVRASLGVLLRAAFQPPKRQVRTILNDISFSLKAGDRLGVVGRNGSGKSTLLKMLVGAYEPTRGYIEGSGSRQALLNLSLGFVGDATLVENIMLRGIAMGLKPAAATSIIDEVLGFSELEEKAGHRLHTLSAGQRMRLGFSLATAVQHQILIMDEWIGTGDVAFVNKAQERIRSRVDNAKVVVLASHNFQLIRNVCTRALVLEDGCVHAFGDVDEVLKEYDRILRDNRHVVLPQAV
ncbi:ABC transporter ATP-binding protein [Lysobacter olei]